MVPPRLECLVSACLLPSLPKPLPGDAGKNRVHYGDVTFPRSHIWAGHPCFYHCQPQKGGEMHKPALFCEKTVSSSTAVP